MQGQPDDSAELEEQGETDLVAEPADDDAPMPDDEVELGEDAEEPDGPEASPADAEEPDEPEASPADAEEPDEEPAAADPLDYEPWTPPARKHRWIARLLVPLTVLIPAAVVFTVVKQATGLGEGTTLDRALVGALRYDGKGDPLVRAPKVDVGKVDRRLWRVCGNQCDKVSGRGERFTPGEVLAGSRIEVRVVGSSGEQTIVTPNWDGRLKALERPTLTGTARVGVTVTANPGKWTGGWIGGEALLGIRACPTKAGGGKCVAFTSSILDGQHAPTRVIPASFRGWWIGAIEWQIPPGRTLTRQPPNPARPSAAERAPVRSVAVATGPLEGPIR